MTALEEVAAEVAVGLEVADDGLDAGASLELALDDAKDAAFLAGAVDPQRFGRVVAAIPLVDVDAPDLDAGEGPGLFDDLAQGVAVPRVRASAGPRTGSGIAVQRLGVEHEAPARRAGVGRRDRDLAAKLVGLVGLALADALDLGGVQGIELPAPLLLALMAHLVGAGERNGEDLLQVGIVGGLAADVAAQPAEAGSQELQLPIGPFELLGVGIAPGHDLRALTDPDVGLAQLDAVLAGQPPEHDDGPIHQLGVGGVGDVLGLHRGVDADALQVTGLHGAGVVGDAQALGEQQLQLVAEALAPVRQPGALVAQLVLEEALAGEVLEIGIVHPALAHALVGQRVDVLEQQQAQHVAARDPGPPLVAEAGRHLLVQPGPVDPLGELNQLVAHVDDLLEPGPEEVARRLVVARLGSHRHLPDAPRES